MREHVRLFESGDLFFVRSVQKVMDYVWKWRESMGMNEVNADIARMPIHGFARTDPSGMDYFTDRRVEDRVKPPVEDMLEPVMRMIGAYEEDDDDKFTEAFGDVYTNVRHIDNPHYKLLSYMLYATFITGVNEIMQRQSQKTAQTDDAINGYYDDERQEIQPEPNTMKDAQPDLDDEEAIYDKIKTRGEGSLTDKEKEFLRRSIGESSVSSFIDFCESLEKKKQ